MKTLILGAQGMLGHDLAAVFKADKPLLWDRDELDITDEKKVGESIQEVAPDLIINAAAYTNVDGAEADKETAFAINAQAVKYIAAAAIAVKARLVHISTEYVFDGGNDAGYDETSEPRPLNIYGQSKAEGERLLAASGCDFYLVRTSWLYGHAPQKGKPRGKNFIDTILDKAGRGEPLKVVNDQFGHPTHAVDLAQSVKKLVTENYAGGIYHVVNEGVASWFDVAAAALRISGLNATITPCSSAEFPVPAARPRYAVLNNNKFSRLRDWQAALADYLNGAMNNG